MAASLFELVLGLRDASTVQGASLLLRVPYFQRVRQFVMWAAVLMAEGLLREFVVLGPNLQMSEEGIVRRCG